MNEGVPQERTSLRGAETLSPELTQVLQEAVQKFALAYKIRQAAGYDYKPSNAVDGNFPLRMQYGQLREEIKRLGRLHDAGEQLDEDDYSRLVKIQAAFDRSYEKVLQYAKEHDINIPEAETNPEPARKLTVKSNLAGEESVNEALEDATISDTMKSHTESVPKPQLAADMHESNPEATITPDSEAVENVPTPEAQPETGLNPETKQALLRTLSEYEAKIEDYRSTLTKEAVDKHPAYQDFTRRAQKLRSLLDGSWTEADTIVTQLVKTEQPRIDALFQTLQSDLQTQREQFEASVGPDMTELRDLMEEVAEPEDENDGTKTQTENAPKKTGWFDPAYRRAHNAAAPQEITNTTTSAAGDVYQLTPDMQVNQVDTENQKVSEASEIGAWPTDPDKVPKFKPEWQQVATETDADEANANESTSEKEASPKYHADSIGEFPTDPNQVPEFKQPWQMVATEDTEPSVPPAATGTTKIERKEPAATMLGLELPPSGPLGASQVAILKAEVGKMLLVVDKKSPAPEKKAVHDAWSILYAADTANGLSETQRQQLAELAPRLPSVGFEAAAAEVKVWQELQSKVPALQEKIQTADTVTKSNWKRRGRNILLAVATLGGLAYFTSDSESPDKVTDTSSKTDTSTASSPDTTAATTDTQEVAPTPDTTEPTLDAPELVQDGVPYVIDSTPHVPDASIQDRHAPEAPEQGPGRTYESPTPVDIDNFDDTNDTTSEASPEVTVTSATDAAPAEREAPTTLPPVEQLLDTMFERSEIEYIFQPGSKINTVSEALWETWKRNSDVLEIDQPLSKAKFLRTMYEVIDETEQNPAVHEALTNRMQIKSGDIDKVFVNERIDLKPLLEKMSAKLKAVTI